MTNVQQWHMPDPPPEEPVKMDICECGHFHYAHYPDCFGHGSTCNCKGFQLHPGYPRPNK